MKTIAAVAGSALFGVFISLAGVAARGAAPQPGQGDDARVAAGKRLFADTCQNDHCHGGSARSVEDMTGVTEEHARKVVADGLPDVGMQSFRGVYTPDQVDAIVAYIMSASGGAVVPQPAHAPGLRGDAAAGRMLLSQTCLACHTFGGQGAHVGPDLTPSGRKPTRDLIRAIVLREGHPSSRMPTDEFASRYSLKQLLDIVAFLKSTDPAGGDVMLKDVF